MEIKETGRSLDFARTCAYLGTVADNTPAHQNPGKTMYLKAKAVNNKQAMKKYAIYTHRDLLTFGSMDVSHGIKGLERQEQAFMKHNRRKVQSREFIIMPADSDNINANDPDSLYHFEKYIQLFMHVHFKGNYPWFADIQPDSHLHSRVHAHLVVLNSNLRTGGAMGGVAYGIKPLRNSLKKTTSIYNEQYEDYKLSQPTQHNSQRMPTKTERYIIQVVNSARQNTNITSRPKFARYLSENGVLAKYRANKKNPGRNGWKFRLAKSKRRYYIKGYRISNTKGGNLVSAKNIAKILSDNRRLKARQRKEVRIKQAQRIRQSEVSAPVIKYHHRQLSSSSVVASSSSSNSASQSEEYQRSSDLDMLRHYQWKQIRSLRNIKDKKRKKQIQYQQVSSSAVQVEHSLNARILAHRHRNQQLLNSYARSSEAGVSLAKKSYQYSLASINNLSLGSNENNILISNSRSQQRKDKIRHNENQRINHIMPRFNTLNAQRYAYWGYSHVIPAKVAGFDGNIPVFAMNDKDKGLFHKLINPIINGFRVAKKWTYSRWQAGKHALVNYCLGANIPILGKQRWLIPKTVNGHHIDVERHEPLINDLAKRDGTFHTPRHLLEAHSFSKSWNNIASKFRQIIHPAYQQSQTSSVMYSNANSSRVSLFRAKSALRASASMSECNKISSYGNNYDQHELVINYNNKRWYRSMVLSTPTGRASYKASLVAKSKATSKFSSVATSNARKRNLGKGPYTPPEV